MTAVRWGYSFGYQDPVALEQRLDSLETDRTTQAATISSIQTNMTASWRLNAAGAGSALSVGSGASVRFAIPAITEQFPNDGSWSRSAGGVIQYAGSLAGVYECHCVTNFQTNLATLQSYTWTVVEGTALATVPVIRDSFPYAVERQLASVNGTSNPTGFLTLLPGGGEIALFGSHTAGLAVTLTPAFIGLLLTRVNTV